jgi:chromate transporter
VGVIALIVRAVHRIADHALVDRWLWLLALVSAAAAALGVSFWITLPAAGLVYAAVSARRFLPAALLAAVALAAVAATGGLPQLTGSQLPADAASLVHQGSAGAGALFLSGLKAGLLTFGGAYTAIPFVRGDAVGRGWVSDGQFLDSLALSGIIPAPLIIFATFIGYLAGGLAGALAMTAGIFLPAFGFALIFYDRLESVIEDERLHRFLEGVAASVVGLIAVTALQLGWNVARSVPQPALAAILFCATLALLYLWQSKLNVLAVVAGSAVFGAAVLAG